MQVLFIILKTATIRENLTGAYMLRMLESQLSILVKTVRLIGIITLT